jgi:hypothetical protein
MIDYGTFLPSQLHQKNHPGVRIFPVGEPTYDPASEKPRL